MKVFEENRHIFLLQKKIEEKKRNNSVLGKDKYNGRFEEEPDDDVWGTGRSSRSPTIEAIEEKKVYSLIMREFHNFKQTVRDKNYDPIDLKSRVYFRSHGYLNLQI